MIVKENLPKRAYFKFQAARKMVFQAELLLLVLIHSPLQSLKNFLI